MTIAEAKSKVAEVKLHHLLRRAAQIKRKYERRRLMEEIRREFLELIECYDYATNAEKGLQSGENCGIMNADDGKQGWITVNGAAVPVGEGGELQGAVGEKIMDESNNGSENGQNTSEQEAAPENTGNSGNLSATGANPNLPGFTSKNLNNHWVGGVSDHSKEYKGWTKEQYAQRALELVCSATSDNVLGYKSVDDAVVRYDRNTNDFVKSGKKGIRTMYKPKRRETYFNEQLIKDGGTQDD